MGLVHKLKLSDKKIAIGLEQRNWKHFILDNTIAEKVILENQNAPPESKEKLATEKKLLEESVQTDGEVCDNNFVEVGKIKEETIENLAVEPSVESLNEQNPIEVSNEIKNKSLNHLKTQTCQSDPQIETCLPFFDILLHCSHI